MSKKLIIETTGGVTLEAVVVEPHDLDRGMTAQEPNFLLRYADGSTLHLNTRNVVAWTEEDVEGEEEGELEAESEPAPEERTVAQLKEALDAKDIDYPSDARKADLVELAEQNNV